MPILTLSVQIASQESNIPAKALFRKWAKAAIRVDTEAVSYTHLDVYKRQTLVLLPSTEQDSQ